MKRIFWSMAVLLMLAGNIFAQKGPFDSEALPPTIDATRHVHFTSIDGAFQPPNTNWLPCLKTLTGGDHTTAPVTLAGHTGVSVSGIKFNNADTNWSFWADKHSIDILLQVYGDEAFLDKAGRMQYFNFLTGTLPEPIAVDGGVLSKDIVNHKWNWVLFRIPNGLRHMDGGRLVGTIHPKAKDDPEIGGVSRNSGQNGGTIRMDGLHELKVRFVAFGEKGAFGQPEQVNVFAK